MSRYIDADKVSTDLKELFEQYILNDNMYLDAVDTSADVQKIIHSEPDAMVHAHWEHDDDGNLFCKRCGAIHGGGFSYCSYCGAKMDEVI